MIRSQDTGAAPFPPRAFYSTGPPPPPESLPELLRFLQRSVAYSQSVARKGSSFSFPESALLRAFSHLEPGISADPHVYFGSEGSRDFLFSPAIP